MLPPVGPGTACLRTGSGLRTTGLSLRPCERSCLRTTDLSLRPCDRSGLRATDLSLRPGERSGLRTTGLLSLRPGLLSTGL